MTDRKRQHPPLIGRPLLRRGAVTSTMDELAALARDDAPEGTVLVADYQSAGRGRAGRIWAAPPDTSLLLSVLLRPRLPPAELTPLALLSAACVAVVVEAVSGLQPQIKWPNDLLITGKKICGILASVTAGKGTSSTVILGFGINVNTAAGDLPPGATSLRAETGRPFDRDELLDLLLAALDDMYVALKRREPNEWWRTATSRLAFVGEPVVVRDATRNRRGILLGVAASGELRLREDDGEVHLIAAGELVRGPRVDRSAK